MHRAYYKFALRVGVVAEKLKIVSLGIVTATMCAGLTACAEDPKYPSLSKISDLGGILTPEERQKAVEDLQKQDQAHGDDAVKTASK
jgi:uncharacterized membrane protein YgcG